jgi:hypothetical protein
VYPVQNADGPSAWRGARCAWRVAKVISKPKFLRRENDISKGVYWPEMARVGESWQELARIGQRWPELA